MSSTLFAMVSLLALLGTAALVGVGSLLAAIGGYLGSRLLFTRSLQAVALVVAGYGAVLAGVSLVSPARVLPPGAEKYFCELDCHLAYSVTGVTQVRATESGSTTWVIRLRTRFDERTISASRSREAPLRPNFRRLRLVGSDGRSYRDSSALTAALGEVSTPITQELRPGESYITVLTYVLPPGVLPSTLDLREDGVLDRLMIGHERSLLHRPVLLDLATS